MRRRDFIKALAVALPLSASAQGQPMPNGAYLNRMIQWTALFPCVLVYALQTSSAYSRKPITGIGCCAAFDSAFSVNANGSHNPLFIRSQRETSLRVLSEP